MRAIDMLTPEAVDEIVIDILKGSIEGVEYELQQCSEDEKGEYRELLTALHKVKKYHEVPNG